MTLLPNGVDERYSRATPDLFESRYGVRDFILYVGHIGWERKNLLRLISAVRALSRPLVLMGPVVAGRYAAACLELAGATPGALVVPGVAPDDPLLQSAYAACDTLVLPSYYETPGLAALEAALAGAKVCVTRYGGTDEYFGVHAEYLEPRSEASIRDAVARSLAKEKTGLLREHVMTNFTWGRVAGGLAGIYRRLADSARP
jgi:glycosyltransferase involved in cell wall biosynthesis